MYIFVKAVFAPNFVMFIEWVKKSHHTIPLFFFSRLLNRHSTHTYIHQVDWHHVFLWDPGVTKSFSKMAKNRSNKASGTVTLYKNKRSIKIRQQEDQNTCTIHINAIYYMITWSLGKLCRVHHHRFPPPQQQHIHTAVCKKIRRGVLLVVQLALRPRETKIYVLYSTVQERRGGHHHPQVCRKRMQSTKKKNRKK